MTLPSSPGAHNPQAEVTKACKPSIRAGHRHGWASEAREEQTATTACAGGSALHNPASVAPSARHICVVSEPEGAEHDPWFQCCHGPTAEVLLVLLRHEDKTCVPASAQMDKNRKPRSNSNCSKGHDALQRQVAEDDAYSGFRDSPPFRPQGAPHDPTCARTRNTWPQRSGASTQRWPQCNPTAEACVCMPAGMWQSGHCRNAARTTALASHTESTCMRRVAYIGPVSPHVCPPAHPPLGQNRAGTGPHCLTVRACVTDTSSTLRQQQRRPGQDCQLLAAVHTIRLGNPTTDQDTRIRTPRVLTGR